MINETIKCRYHTDPIFYRVVVTMRGWLSGFPDMGGCAGLSTEGLRNATEMACAMHEEEQVRKQQEELKRRVKGSESMSKSEWATKQ